MSRYTIRPTPPKGHTFGIWDERFRDFCGLPRERGGPGWWLEFATPEKAHEWLDLCLRTWATWEHSAPPGYGRRAATSEPRSKRARTNAKTPRQSS